jgi:hypothetical protein
LKANSRQAGFKSKWKFITTDSRDEAVDGAAYRWIESGMRLDGKLADLGSCWSWPGCTAKWVKKAFVWTLAAGDRGKPDDLAPGLRLELERTYLQRLFLVNRQAGSELLRDGSPLHPTERFGDRRLCFDLTQPTRSLKTLIGSAATLQPCGANRTTVASINGSMSQGDRTQCRPGTKLCFPNWRLNRPNAAWNVEFALGDTREPAKCCAGRLQRIGET